MMILKTQHVMLIAFFLCFISCDKGRPHLLVLSDFESDADLDSMQWRCHTLFSLSDENATHGNKSLKLELYPSDYPGITFEHFKHDWSKYKILSLDIYNPQDEAITLAVRIDDLKRYPDFDDRYTNSFSLKPGINHLKIPLTSLSTPGTKRSINLKTINRFLIFMARPSKKYVLYFDYLHLI